MNVSTADLGVRGLESPLRLRKRCQTDRKRPRKKASERHVSANAYLFEQAKPVIRSRRLKVTKVRRFRDGKRPQSIGTGPLRPEERKEFALLEWELREAGVYQARPKVFADCMPLRCPWCTTDATMSVIPADSDEHQSEFACPNCNRRLTYVQQADGSIRWERSRSNKPVPLTRENAIAYYWALNHAGPCPYVSCRHNLYLRVDEESGAIKVNFPGEADGFSEMMRLHLAPAFPAVKLPALKSMADLGENIGDLKETCALRVAFLLEDTESEMTLEEIGVAMNITQERANQVFRAGNEQLQYALAEFAEP